jgi:signal peptidase I
LKERLIKFYRWSNTWTGTIVIVLLVIFFVAQAFVIPSGSMKNTLLIGDHLFVKKFAYGVPTPHIPWVEIPVVPDLDGDGHLIEGPKPQREDIVIFRYPPHPKTHYVKRCVATGGDELIFASRRLLVHFKEGDEYIRAHYPEHKIRTIGGKLWVQNPYIERHPGIHYSDDRDSFELMAYALLRRMGVDMEPVFVPELQGKSPTFALPGVQGSLVERHYFNAFYRKVPEGEFYMIGDNRDHSNDSRFWGPVPYRLIVGKPWFVYWSWDENYIPRWERIGKSVEALEEQMRRQR